MSFRLNADSITTNYTRTLAEFIADLKYEDIPAEVRERAKLIAIQTIGVGLAAGGTPIGDRAVSIAKSCGYGEPAATLWTDGSKVSMTAAAFAAGTLLCDGKTYLKVACQDGFIHITSLQLAGKKRLDICNFLRGFQFSDTMKMQ